VYRIKIKHAFIQIETDRFKDFILSLRFYYPNQEPYVSSSNLLSYMMSDRTLHYPSKQAFNRKMDELYGLYLDVRTSSMGLHHCLEFRVKTLNAAFMKDVRFSEVFDFLEEVLKNPLLKQDVFDEAVINYQNALTRMLDKPQTVGLRLALEAFGPNVPISTPSQGSLDGLSALRLSDVQSFYTYLMAQPNILIYHGHPLDAKHRNQLKRLMSTPVALERSAYAFTSETTYSQELIKDIRQTTLTHVYQTNLDYHHPQYLAFRLMTIMLGQMPNSLLFQEIREKRSLCYSIHANSLNFDGLVVIQTGIAHENLDLVESLIQEQIERLQSHLIHERLLRDAKRVFINGLQSLSDDPYASVNFVAQRVHESLDVDLRKIIQDIKQTSLEEVIASAQQLKLISRSVVRGQD